MSWNPFAPGSIDLGFTTTNTGNVQLDASSRVNGTVSTPRMELLPSESRDAAVVIDGIWPTGPVTVDIVGNATFDGDAAFEPATRSVVIWAVPWPQLLLLVSIALIAFAAVSGRRTARRRLAAKLREAREAGRRDALG